MLVHSNRDRPARYRPWSERTHQRSGPTSDSLIAVSGLSLAGLATSLFVLGSPRIAEAFPHDFALAVLEAGIIAAAVGIVVAVVCRPGE
jgi:hypothetical protein